jgi:hypothetical protein
MESIGPRELAADLRGGIVSPGFRNSVLDSSEPTTPVQNRRTQQRPFLSHLPRSYGPKKLRPALAASRPRSGRCSPIGFVMAQNEAGELSVLYFARHNFKLKIIGAGWGMILSG